MTQPRAHLWAVPIALLCVSSSCSTPVSAVAGSAFAALERAEQHYADQEFDQAIQEYRAAALMMDAIFLESICTHRLEDELENADLAKRIRTSTIGPLTFKADGSGAYLEVFRRLDERTRIPIIVTPWAAAVISNESLTLEKRVAKMPLRDMLDHMTGRSENVVWTIRNGVVVIASKIEADRPIESPKETK